MADAPASRAIRRVAVIQARRNHWRVVILHAHRRHGCGYRRYPMGAVVRGIRVVSLLIIVIIVPVPVSHAAFVALRRRIQPLRVPVCVANLEREARNEAW